MAGNDEGWLASAEAAEKTAALPSRRVGCCARCSLGAAALEVDARTAATVVASGSAVSAPGGVTAAIFEVDVGFATGLVAEGLSAEIELSDGGVTAGIFGIGGGLGAKAAGLTAGSFGIDAGFTGCTATIRAPDAFGTGGVGGVGRAAGEPALGVLTGALSSKSAGGIELGTELTSASIPSGTFMPLSGALSASSVLGMFFTASMKRSEIRAHAQMGAAAPPVAGAP